ncbi:uncharacterized protein EDB91DRAFT_1256305 [Suillus paluster]|uniref:uncharacterized protein n=1 Tax=Suillus paluster TaxID=48578 RepID=UPI001B86F8D2|nr:uncharacterized protein EDB91DRAFT_1256305 [Suillus paluster]KAG1721900.1 hypothetical protein EDB91DRAFT_1256305 [Suillus paluster]
MSHIISSYASHIAFLRNGMNLMPVIPEDWALHATNCASEWVEQQFLAHIAGGSLVDPPPGMDVPTLLSCGQLAWLMAEAYRHLIKLDIDVIRYNEALAKRESGMKDAREEELLARFPPPEKMLLDWPSVVIDSGHSIILWYIPNALSPWVQNDMYMATLAMGDLLKKSIINKESANWRTWGCINITPCWFQQGYECYGPPPNNLDDGFKPEVSASLKGDRSLSMIMDMQRPALLASAALHVMHPKLYWASVRTHIKLSRWSEEQGLHDMHRLLKHWASVYTGAAVMCNCQSPDHRDPKCLPEAFDILTCIGSYPHAVMQLTNLGIELVYNPGVMVSYSGHLVRHGIHIDEGDRMVWAWFLRDSVHNYARTPCPDYATYNPVDLHAYQLAKYNQADFVVYGNR